MKLLATYITLIFFTQPTYAGWFSKYMNCSNEDKTVSLKYTSERGIENLEVTYNKANFSWSKEEVNSFTPVYDKVVVVKTKSKNGWLTLHALPSTVKGLENSESPESESFFTAKISTTNFKPYNRIDDALVKCSLTILY